jgi:hypothetical protein
MNHCFTAGEWERAFAGVIHISACPSHSAVVSLPDILLCQAVRGELPNNKEEVLANNRKKGGERRRNRHHS